MRSSRRSLAFVFFTVLAVQAACVAGKVAAVDTPADAGTVEGSDGAANPTSDAAPPDDVVVLPDLGPLSTMSAPAQVASVGERTDGPAWSLVESALYFTTPTGNGALRRLFPSDGHVELLREGTSPSDAPVANSIYYTQLVTADRTHVRASLLDGGNLAISADGGVDGGDDAGGAPFRWLRSVATRDGYFTYVTDPGDGTDPSAPGRIFAECPPGRCAGDWRWIVDETHDGRRPTGIAVVSGPTDAGYKVKLYAGYAADGGSQVRTIDEDSYTGVFLYTSKKVCDLPDPPEGVAVDESGNVYVAWAGGIDVYAPDGTRFGGHPGLPVAGSPTGLTFGGIDRKTLYVTTAAGTIYAIDAPIAGAQSKQ